MKTLQGPTYTGIDREHKYFAVLEQSWAHLRNLANPDAQIEREHGFVDLGKKLESLKDMTYPVREGVDYNHQFNQIQNKVVSLRNLSGKHYFTPKNISLR